MANINAYFSSRFVFNPKRDIVWKEICRFLQQRYIPAQSVILEIGSGHCHFINNIQGREKHALDVSSEMLGFIGHGVHGHVQSCTSLNEFEDSFFDTVFASNVFEHLTREEMQKALVEVKRILKDDGKLIIVQPNFKYCCKEYFDDYTHIQVFTHVGLHDFLVALGFTVVDLKTRFLPFSMKSRLPKASLFIKLYLRLPFKPLAGQMLVVAQNSKKGV